MASGFFAILDDIAVLMDDVALSSKIATQKTAGILGDDLAVNAEKATGFLSSRELPVLWKIMKGSFLNKLIILPIIFVLNFYLPDAIKIILILGGFYLAFEGVEKIIEYLFHKDNQTVHEEALDVMDDPIAEENKKVKSAVITDFILSLEIVIIALGTVLDKNFKLQLITVSVVSIIATVGVYGIVALIVRMDDTGFKLIKKSKNKGIFAKIGQLLVDLLPWVIKILSVVGTLALLLVAGGIFAHNLEFVHHAIEHSKIPTMLIEFILGIIGGLIGVLIYTIGKKILKLVKVAK